jgi:hypothetical protein
LIRIRVAVAAAIDLHDPLAVQSDFSVLPDPLSVRNILSSNEYRTDFIQGWYQKYLSRAASGSEVSAWLGTFDSGGTDEQIIAAIVGSDEYFNRAGICSTFLPRIMR